jgi:hypothetical protein
MGQSALSSDLVVVEFGSLKEMSLKKSEDKRRYLL